MDTAELETNVLLFNNVTSVAFRVYRPAEEQLYPFSLSTHEIDDSLRSSGRIACCDVSRRWVWLFRLSPKGEAVSPDHATEDSIEVCGFTLALAEAGVLEAASLMKGRLVPSPLSTNTPMSSASASTADTTQKVQSALLPSSSGLAVTETIKGPGSSGSDAKPQSSVSLKDAYENFMNALLCGTCATFCRMTGAIPLTQRTVLVSQVPRISDSASDTLQRTRAPVVATFRVYLTTAGSLVISASLAFAESLVQIQDLPSRSALNADGRTFFAPFGVFARYHGPFENDLSAVDVASGQTPNTQLWRARQDLDSRSSQWRQACMKLLGVKGVPSSLLQNCSWVTLQIFKPRVGDHRMADRRVESGCITWPKPLCFLRKKMHASAGNKVGGGILMGHEETYDPLSSARNWFAAGSERDQKLLSKRRDREAAAKLSTHEGDNRVVYSNGTSPHIPRRPSNAAAGAMYPTPPDGVQNATAGVTPSLDGTVLSPPNGQTSTAAVDMESSVPNASVDDTSYGESWAGPDPKREPGDGIFDGGGGDDIFDDMGGGMFAEDITDADFNFFDAEPDEGGLDLSSGQEMDATQDTPAATQHPPVPAIDTTAEIPKAETENGTFAKPEQKSASSKLIEEKEAGGSRQPAKRQPSPFDEETVYKKVRASLLPAPPKRVEGRPSLARRGSEFEMVRFENVRPIDDRKYEADGRFGYNMASFIQNSAAGISMPSTLKWNSGVGTQNRGTDWVTRASLIRKLTAGIDGIPTLTPQGPEGLGPDDAEADGGDDGDDDDEYSDTSDEMGSPVRSSVRRLNLDDDLFSQATSARDPDFADEGDPAMALELPKIARLRSELSVSRCFSDPEPLGLQISLPDEDCITIAQILTDQAASGSLAITLGDTCSDGVASSLDRRDLAQTLRQSMAALRSCIPEGLGQPVECNFRTFVDVQDVPIIGQPSRIQPRAIQGQTEQTRPPTLYQIPAPHIELRRHDSKLSLLPSAVTFWESLGLSPSRGAKDITAVCVFPSWNGMSDNVETFLGRMCNVYESFKMGSFEQLALQGGESKGLLPYEPDKISTSPDAVVPGIGSALSDRMETLNQALAEVKSSKRNFVTFFVYSPQRPASIIECCSAFQLLFEMHRRTLADSKSALKNDLVLQLIPVESLSSPSTLVIPSPAESQRLCVEVYDRCTLFSGPMPAPSILLDQPPPRVIDFKPTLEPSESLMHENTCIHVAYVHSVDSRWVTAAWSDNRGHQQMTASYCLGRKGKPIVTPIGDILKAIWDTTHDILSLWKVHWRVMVVKCGPMSQQETDEWISLAQSEQRASVSLTLLTADTNPSLQLLPPNVRFPLNASSSFYTTPVTTPQANILSPEQSGNPSTPARESQASATATPGGPGSGAADGPGSTTDADSDAVLIETTDQTWGAILAHRLSNSTSLLDVRPSLVSGYLVKRGGPRVEDPPVVMEVNLVHSDMNPRAYEPLLREILAFYRGLGTVARVRGVVDKERDVRPWHVAAAEKAVRVLYLLM